MTQNEPNAVELARKTLSAVDKIISGNGSDLEMDNAMELVAGSAPVIARALIDAHEEIERLKHDISRHVEISASMAEELAENARTIGMGAESEMLLIAKAEKLKRRVEVMQWRDIASAPKDGSLIDLWVTWMPGTPNKEVRSYRVPKCFWNHKGKKWDTLCYTHDGKRQMYGETPTHWMPLPPAPVSADNGD